MGPHTLVIKRGEYAPSCSGAATHFVAPGYLLETLIDPTGAGDCFAGGFMGYLADGESARRGAMRMPPNCAAPWFTDR